MNENRCKFIRTIPLNYVGNIEGFTVNRCHNHTNVVESVKETKLKEMKDVLSDANFSKFNKWSMFKGYKRQKNIRYRKITKKIIEITKTPKIYAE